MTENTTSLAPTDAEIDHLLATHWPAVFAVTEAVIQWRLRHAVREAIAKWGAPTPASGEAMSPFGYFRAEPFGWTDCAESDEGAKPLYESPPPAQEARESCTLSYRIAELAEQHGSLRAVARSLACDPGYLARLQSGEKCSPSPALLERLGLRQVITYERGTT